MDPKIIAALKKIEPELRKLAGNVANATFSITLDANGTMYAANLQDADGSSENFNKRVPVTKG